MPIVTLRPEAAKDLDKLPLNIRARMAGIIQRLEKWPDVSGAKPLAGNLAGKYRLRTGDYRIQFFIDTGQVVIEKIGHRDGFYE